MEPQPAAEAISKQRLRLWLQLLKATHSVEQTLRENLRLQFAMTLPRFDVLAVLARRPTGLKMSELSSKLMVSNGNVTGIVDRLVADGMVVRVASHNDKRAFEVRMTSKGEAEFKVMAAAHETWIDELLGGVEQSEMCPAGALLAKIRRSPQ